MKNRQAQVIQHMSNKEVLLHLYLTQAILLVIAIILGAILFDNWQEFGDLWKVQDWNILILGGGSATFVVIIDMFMMKLIPKELYDDGGINKKVFQSRAIPHLFFLSLIISSVEEVLFRGVLQTNVGLIMASLIFALLHFRYLTKWVLFISVVVLSFLLGIIYEMTGNIWVTIFSHFLIDFVSAVKIRVDFIKAQKEVCI